MKYLWHWSSLLTQALCLDVAQELTPSAPARSAPSVLTNKTFSLAEHRRAARPFP
jgi:hypothetical protein